MTAARRGAATCVLAALLAGATAAQPAAASPPPAPLSAAMLAADAANSGTDLHTWLHNNAATVATSQLAPPQGTAVNIAATITSPEAHTGAGTASLGMLAGAPLTAATPAALGVELDRADVGLSPRDFTNLGTLGVAVQTSTGDWDSIATLAGARWLAADAAAAGGIKTPSAAQLAALPVGAWLARAAVPIKTAHPGRAPSTAAAAGGADTWRAAVADAWTAHASELSAATADSCDRALLHAAAGEQPGADTPTVAVAAGAWLHETMDAVGDPNSVGSFDPLVDVFSAASTDTLPAATVAALNNGDRLDGAVTLCGGATTVVEARTPALLARAAAAARHR